MNECGNKTYSPPNCEATIQGINVTKPLFEKVEVTGARENLTFYITRPVPPPTVHQPQPSTTSTSAATSPCGNYCYTTIA